MLTDESKDEKIDNNDGIEREENQENNRANNERNSPKTEEFK